MSLETCSANLPRTCQGAIGTRKCRQRTRSFTPVARTPQALAGNQKTIGRPRQSYDIAAAGRDPVAAVATPVRSYV